MAGESRVLDSSARGQGTECQKGSAADVHVPRISRCALPSASTIAPRLLVAARRDTPELPLEVTSAIGWPIPIERVLWVLFTGSQHLKHSFLTEASNHGGMPISLLRTGI